MIPLVGDDDRHRHPEAGCESLTEPLRRRVGIAGQESHHARGDAVRFVDTRVGAHPAVTGLADEVAAIHADDPVRLPEDDLQCAGVLGALRSGGEVLREGRRLDLLERDHGTLRLRDDLLADGDDVPGLQPHAGRVDRVAEELPEIVARVDERETRDGNDGDRQGVPSSAPRTSPARRAAAAGVRITVSVTSVRTPSASTRDAQPRSTRSSTNTSTSPR